MRNGDGGIWVTTSAGYAPTTVMLFRSVVADNARGLVAVGQGAKILVGHSVLTGNGDPALFGLQGAWQTVNGGTIFSYGDNYVDGNGSMESAPPRDRSQIRQAP